jgi:hypothetical protein
MLYWTRQRELTRIELTVASVLASCGHNQPRVLRMRTTRPSFVIITTALFVCTVIQTAQSASFQNGSFETPQLAPGVSQVLAPGPASLPGWNVGTNGRVELLNAVSTSVNAVDGVQLLFFNSGNAATGGTISQTFNTTIGQIYGVGFYVGRTGSGGGTMSLLAEVTSSTNAVLATSSAVAPSAPGYGPAQTLTFTATTTNTTLTFTDTSSATVAVDVLLDNVSVVPASPPPVPAFTNGSFELPVIPANSSQSVAAGSSSLPGWVVGSSGELGLINGLSFGVGPVDGAQHLGFNGGNTAPSKTISQTFSTAIGQRNIVTFYVGRYGSGSGTMQLQAEVTSGTNEILGTLLGVAPVSPGYGPAQTFTFTATTDSSTLTFRDTSTGTIGVDVALDNVSVTPIPECEAPPAGLVGWWRGEGDASDVVTGSFGTLSGGINFTNGQVGRAFSFDGTGGVSIGDSPTLNVQRFTIDAWVFPAVLDGEMETIVYKERDTGGGGQYALAIKGPTNTSCAGTIPTGHFAFAILGISGLPTGEFCGWVDGGATVPTNQWSHVAVAFDGSSVRAYVNGILTRTITNLSGSVTVSTGPLKIGSRSSAIIAVQPRERFNGLIDEVDLFDRALATPEIQSIYNAGSFGKCVPSCIAAPAGLVSWWGAELNTRDVRSGNHGTLLGQASYAPGKIGSAFAFDGNGDGVAVGNPTNLQLQNFTIEGWIKRDSPVNATQSGSANGTIFGYSWGGYAFALFNDGRLLLTKVGANYVASIATVADTNWHHVAVTKLDGTVTFYVDGVAGGQTNYEPGFTFSTSAAIGTTGDLLTDSFYGSIDDLSIYTRALTATELQTIYNAGSEGKCAPSSLVISPKGGFFTNSVTVTINAPSTNAQVRFTMDGSDPTTNSPVYSGPIAVTNTATVKAQAFLNNSAISEIVCEAYRFWSASSGCVAPAGAISWWTGDCMAEDVLGLNHGVLTGNAIFGPGLIAQAFSFEAEGDGVTVNNSPSLQLQTFTIEAWVRRKSTNQATLGVYGGGAVFAYGSGGYGLSVFDDGRLTLTKVGVNYVASSTRVSDTNWHHVAVTKAGTNVAFYVDGVLGGTTNYSTTFTFGANAAIGTTGGTGVATFYGLIDELAIYARALSTNEIQSLFTAGATGKCPAFEPVIITQPQNRAVLTGASATFSVTAGGSPPLSYQWLFNGAIITNATNAAITITSAQSTNAGNYAVTVSNAFGSTNSAPATLTINTPPNITTQPASQTALIGATVTFTVSATGTPTPTYQWRRNGISIPAATGPILVINNVQSTNAGTYTVRVSNSVGAVTSDPAVLTVASGQISSLAFTPSGVELTVQGEAGANYTIETSSDLVDWQPLVTLFNNPPNWQFTDPTATGVSQRFYRLKKAP